MTATTTPIRASLPPPSRHPAARAALSPTGCGRSAACDPAGPACGATSTRIIRLTASR
ncbi:hypothetical protein [Streptomyces endophyticus]|uniref:Uncharacterized protein n=1 Tax=Streptomyces endophyticus TaxID=714166 RepID=A0ABU6EYN5_9ACTN|nr:hypothetical protein [Streptomyces endophyticus]MEB8336863.1 hypothetical protein [Streptomyces endophyticus]